MFYFIGGEDHDFTKLGAVAVDTATTAARRTANARCSLRASNTSGAIGSEEWRCDLSQAVSALWLTARFYISALSSGTGTNYFICLFDGVNRRLFLTTSTGGAGGFWRLSKRDTAGTVTVLATSSVGFVQTALQKLDMYVNYAVGGNVKVYLDGTLIIDYAGDVTTNGATTLSSLGLAHPIAVGTGTQFTYWSEIIAASEDTRAMGLVTLPPAANGNTFNWTGSYADLDEITLNDADIATSASAGQLAQTTIASSGITGTPAIRAVCVSARAQKGGTGPQNAKMNVRTGGMDHLGSTLSLPVAMARAAYVFETNPGTSGPWAYTDITAVGFNIGIQSEA